MSTQDLIEQARDAGRNHGTAHRTLCTAISEAASSYGIRDYTDGTVQGMRAAFAEACAANGTTKNNGLGLFARAWDSLKAQYGLEDRPRKGSGRNTKPRASKVNVDSIVDIESTEEPVRETIVYRARELTEAERQEIKDQGAREFLQASKLDTALVQTLLDAWGGLRDPSANVAKDAQFALLEACKAIGSALVDSRLVTADSIKALRPIGDSASTSGKAANDKGAKAPVRPRPAPVAKPVATAKKSKKKAA